MPCFKTAYNVVKQGQNMAGIAVRLGGMFKPLSCFDSWASTLLHVAGSIALHALTYMHDLKDSQYNMNLMGFTGLGCC